MVDRLGWKEVVPNEWISGDIFSRVEKWVGWAVVERSVMVTVDCAVGCSVVVGMRVIRVLMECELQEWSSDTILTSLEDCKG